MAQADPIEINACRDKAAGTNLDKDKSTRAATTQAQMSATLQ